MNQQPESLQKRLGRFVAWVTAVFGITAAVIITQRLSADSLALLVGLTCGIAAMVPTLGLGFFIWRRALMQHETIAQHQAATSAMSPPVVIVSPQALPGYGMPQHPAVAPGNVQTWGQPTPSTQRQFMIVGDDE